MVSRAEGMARLAGADWLRRDATRRVFSVLDGATGRTRAVGGIVRDTILGRARAGAEIDLATELLPTEVMARAAAAGLSAHPTGIDHGTVTIALEGTVVEVTTLREDVATDGRRAVVRFGTDWTRDAERRDFTLNALYADAEGNLLDPLDGLDDCLIGRVRFIGDPAQRIAEDRLRVYRFFRFSASHGAQRFDAEGLTACRLAAGTLGRLSAERVGAEMVRMLALEKVALTLQAMVLAGVLALGPEEQRLLTSYEQRATPPTLAGRLALIIAGAGAAAIKARWRLGNSLVSAAESVLEAARLLEAGRLNEAAYRHRSHLADAAVIAAIRLHWDDARFEGTLAEAGTVNIPGFPISGRDLGAAGYRQGPGLGEELSRLEQAWIESGFALDRPALLAMLTPPG